MKGATPGKRLGAANIPCRRAVERQANRDPACIALMQDRVLVYRYLFWDEASRQHKLSERYATLEMIRKGLGTPVHQESLLVRSREIAEGFYLNRPSRRS